MENIENRKLFGKVWQEKRSWKKVHLELSLRELKSDDKILSNQKRTKFGFFPKFSNFLLPLFEKLSISGPENVKIWNLDINHSLLDLTLKNNRILCCTDVDSQSLDFLATVMLSQYGQFFILWYKMRWLWLDKIHTYNAASLFIFCILL